MRLIIKSINVITIALFAIIVTSSVSLADSPPVLPNTFSGTVKFANSSGQFDVPAGTLIEAFMDNVSKGNTLTSPSNYSIDVIGTPDDDGKLITFRVNNYTASQTAVFSANNPPPKIINLIIALGPVIPLPGMSTTPTDPDGDGLYEDLNGNGRKDFNDVVLFFNNLEWIAGNEPRLGFDFNGNGRIDFADIVKLFEEV